MSADTMLDWLFYLAIFAGLVAALKRGDGKQSGAWLCWALLLMAATTTLWIMWGNATGNWDVARIPLGGLASTLIFTAVVTIARGGKP